MARKRKSKRIDEFLRSRQQGQEVVLRESTRQANLLFRIVVTVLLVALLLLLLNIGEKDEFQREQIGVAGLLTMVTVLGVLVINRIQPALFQSTAKFNQFVLLIVLTVSLSWGMFALNWPAYLLPLPALAMIAGLAYSSMVAILLCGGLAAYLALLAPAPYEPFQLAVTLSLGAVVSVLGVRNMRKQSQPVLIGLRAGFVQAVTVICFKVMEDFSGSEDVGFLASFLQDPGYALMGGLISGGIVTSLLPQIEKIFDVLTERRLLELADPSNQLLNILRTRAPGTFQHTLGVQQLAREAPEAIGGNVLLASVGAYYHDIGKMIKPEYFRENQGLRGGRNPHDHLTPNMSMLIIASHVKDGLELAEEHGLPQSICDLIPEHHGTTGIEVFYNRAVELGGESVRKDDFRYDGPRPQTKVGGILMLADSVESAARTLPERTPNRVRQLVRNIIQQKFTGGEWNECALTLQDLHKIEDSFIPVLMGTLHGRVEYPWQSTDRKWRAMHTMVDN